MHIDRTDREAGTQRERERETADSWLAKQTDRQQTSPHLHIFPNLTSYIFTSWHLLIFTSSHLHIHLHIFSFSHFSSSHLLIFTPSKISSHLHIFSSSHPHISHLLIFTLHIFTPSHIHICSSSHLLILTLSSSHLGFRELVAANPVKHDLALHQTPPRPSAPNLPEPSPEPSLEPCRTFSGTKVNPWNHPQKNASEKKPSAHLPEEWHLRKGLNSNLILLIHAQ